MSLGFRGQAVRAGCFFEASHKPHRGTRAELPEEINIHFSLFFPRANVRNKDTLTTPASCY